MAAINEVRLVIVLSSPTGMNATRFIADDGANPRDELLRAFQTVNESASADNRLRNCVLCVFITGQFPVGDPKQRRAVPLDKSSHRVRVTTHRPLSQPEIFVHNL